MPQVSVFTSIFILLLLSISALPNSCLLPHGIHTCFFPFLPFCLLAPFFFVSASLMFHFPFSLCFQMFFSCFSFAGFKFLSHYFSCSSSKPFLALPYPRSFLLVSLPSCVCSPSLTWISRRGVSASVLLPSAERLPEGFMPRVRRWNCLSLCPYSNYLSVYLPIYLCVCLLSCLPVCVNVKFKNYIISYRQ